MAIKIPTRREIELRFDLLKKVNGTDKVSVSDLAKELSVKKTDLMQIIIGNPTTYNWERGIRTKQAILTKVNNP